MALETTGRTPVQKSLKLVLRAVAMGFFFLSLSVGYGQELTDRQKVERIGEMFAEYQRSFPDTPFVTVPEVIEMLNRGNTVLVDRRTRAEQEISMLPGAITSEDFEKNIEKYRDKNVVVYCTVGYRSGHYTKRLLKKGIRAVNLKGGILAWIHAGQSVVDKDGKTRRVHVYGSKWNLTPQGYEAVW